MPVSILIALIAGLTIVTYFVLRPLRVMDKKEFLISHGFIVVGILIVLGWLWLNGDQFRQATMIMGGIWTLSGGLCFAAVYALRRLKAKS
ncbi:MAG: hypothetical protein ABSC22_11740 [Roseiarcus sp.]